MKIKTEDIKKIREQTGAGVMEVKKALEEAKGDLDRAVDIIEERGLVKAEKKADRATSAGLVISYLHNDRIGVLLEIHCETDFVARLEDFRNLAHNIAMQIAAMEPESVEDLLKQDYIRDPEITIADLIKGVIAKTGENIQVTKFCRYAL